MQAVTLISAVLITNLQQHLFINLGTQADAHKLCKLMWLPSCNWQELRQDTYGRFAMSWHKSFSLLRLICRVLQV